MSGAPDLQWARFLPVALRGASGLTEPGQAAHEPGARHAWSTRKAGGRLKARTLPRDRGTGPLLDPDYLSDGA